MAQNGIHREHSWSTNHQLNLKEKCIIKLSTYVVSYSRNFLSYRLILIQYSQTCEQRPSKGQYMVFIGKWSLFGGMFVYLINKRLLKCGLCLQGGLNSKVSQVLLSHYKDTSLINLKIYPAVFFNLYPAV